MKRIGDVGEFALIARIERRAERDGVLASGDIRLGIGDDAAVLRPRVGEEVVLTTDAFVEDVHFRFDREAAAHIGRRALVANLSDVAAMGARPIGFTFALAAPPSLPLARFDGLVDGLLREARTHGCPLVGGNLTRARETSLTLAVLGGVARGRALRRGDARVGDRILVTGELGRFALARLRAEQAGTQLRALQTPRLGAGRALARLAERGACVDISDGLAADLEHLLGASGLGASGLGAEINIADIPRPRGFAAACARLGADPETVLLAGGEDYELLFTLRRARRPTSVAALSRRLGVMVTEVGRVAVTGGVRGLPRLTGWRHF